MAWQKKVQFVTLTQGIQKLEKFCAYQERSQKQVHEKCRSLGLTESETGEVMIHLLQNDFFSESRFAHAYVKGKSKIKTWGSEKIRQGLKQAGVSDALIREALSQLQDVDTQLHLEKWAAKKLKVMKFSEDSIAQILSGDLELSYEDKQKVKQFLFGKGYSVEAQLAMLGFLKNWTLRVGFY